MLLTWSCVRSSWEWAQLEQLRLPGHLLLPDVMNLKEEKWSFPLSAFKQAESLAQGKAQSHRQVVTGFPASYSRDVLRQCKEPWERGRSPPKNPSNWGCASSEPTATAQTLPLSGAAKSVGHSCHGTLKHSKELSAASTWPSHTELVKTPLKTYSGRPAIFIT